MPRRPPIAIRCWRPGRVAATTTSHRRNRNGLVASASHGTNSQCATSLPIILATNESLFETLHTTVGLPWWGAIVGLTCALRAGMTLPVALYQQKSIGRMIELAPMVQSWGETLKKQLATSSRNAGWDYERYNKELQKEYRKKVNEIYMRHGCARWQLLLLPWVQIPLWVSMSLTLRHLTGLPLPWYGQTADYPATGMCQEGFGWVTDLTLPDPTITFPLLIGAGTLINVEVLDIQ
ncbi:60Kd inner membrane protein-domain-containing protein [Dichotomocladium elegans]|nr:60Kd inner membrane protein-domain-containing protein [Dichotomocladium elegans]